MGRGHERGHGRRREGGRPEAPLAGAGPTDWLAQLEDWVDAGLDPELFWTLGLPEVRAIQRGARSRMQREREADIRQAWTVAALIRTKKMPSLESMLAAARPVVRQSWQQQAAQLVNW